MNIEKELAKRLMNEGESGNRQEAYNSEISFYELVASGNIHRLEEALKTLGANQTFGVLSPDKVRNVKYHTVILTALVSRFCIEAGLEISVAYNLSDIYIRKIDTCNNVESINEIHKELCENYVKRMQGVKKQRLYSRPITQCIDYIYDNLHNKISLDDLAQVSGLSTSYVSKLFHSEVGITIAQYIQSKKIEVAKNLLIFSDYTTTDIANYLQFSSESYFINVFRKNCGITPKKYRVLHFRTKFTAEDSKS